MPELPEVETIKNDLLKKVVGRKILGINFIWPGIVKEISPKDFEHIVVGKKIIDARRRAKNLYLVLEDDLNILMHMKMTGHLIVTSADWKVDEAGRWITKQGSDSHLTDPLNQYIRIIFKLSGGDILAFSDLRKFAYVKLLSGDDIALELKKYGPEPLTPSFNSEYLSLLVSGKKTAIKKFLMDPKNVSGIGNIYADEILWHSMIHPLREAGAIKRKEVDLIIENTKKILNKAIEMRGTSTSDFRDSSGEKGSFGEALSVYRKTNEPCPRDGVAIKRIVVGGRGTHFCPKCQKEPG